MERLGRPKKRGLSKHQLLVWGMLFLLAGMISRGVLQTRVLQMGNLSTQQLLEAMSSSGAVMATATAALIMQALETCAVPIFAFLLVEGFEKTQNKKKMTLYLLSAAIVSEIPYNLAIYGKYLHMTSRNPVVGMVIGMAVLFFFRRYSGMSFQNVLVKIFVGLAALLWSIMLNVDHGVALLVVIMTMWALREKKQLRVLFAAMATSICMLISPLYIVSAMGVLPVHFYVEEEESTDLKLASFFIYAILLLSVGLLTILI